MKTGTIFNKRYAIGVMVVLIIGVAAKAMQAQDSFGEEIFSSGLEMNTTKPQPTSASAPAAKPIDPSSLPDIELSVALDEPTLGGVKQDPFGIEQTSSNAPSAATAKPSPSSPVTSAQAAQPVQTVPSVQIPAPKPSAAVKPSTSRVSSPGSGAPDDALLGKISNDMLKELADIDRENAKLELELRREQLRGDISNAQSTQRRARLEEIQKREEMIRLQEEWKMERAKREQELVEAKERAQIRRRQIESALKRAEQTGSQNQQGNNSQGQDVPFGLAGNAASSAGMLALTKKQLEITEQYVVMEVRGTGDDLSARIASTDGTQMYKLPVGGRLPTGHVVEEISTEGVMVSKDGQNWHLSMFNGSLRQSGGIAELLGMGKTSGTFGQSTPAGAQPFQY